MLRAGDGGAEVVVGVPHLDDGRVVHNGVPARCQRTSYLYSTVCGAGRCGAFFGMLLADLLIRVTTGRIYMPSTINLYQIGVWFCVGFFTGAGWAIAAVLVGRILSIV